MESPRPILRLLSVVLLVAACVAAPTGTPTMPRPPSGPPAASTPAATGIPGQIAVIGEMSTPRAAHTATALPDGHVLVAGGCTRNSCEGITASTELIDPATGTSTAGPEMTEPRVGHAAVPLADGRVLLIGGFGPGTVTKATDIFDPSTGAMSRGPDLLEPRADPIAILLPDGSLLVAGGFDGERSMATAEILDPGAAAFRSTAAMAVPRSADAGVLLGDGRVLIVGGNSGGDDSEIHASAEIYDPAAGTWSTTGSMSVPRHKLAAVTLADGRVLVVGGSDDRDAFGQYRSAELFDPETDTFSKTGAMAFARYKINGAVVLLPDGRVLVAGGAPLAEIFDPDAGTWSRVLGDDDLELNFTAAARVTDGSVIVTGGYDTRIALRDEVLRFVP